MTNAFKPLSAGDIENRIEELRKSYAPEWKFDRDNPDAGSVIAQIFALSAGRKQQAHESDARALSHGVCQHAGCKPAPCTAGSQYGYL